jgi:transcriptional regulator with XRE-family HTH domain
MVSEIDELRQARLEDDLTYRQLAERLQVSGSQVHRILNSTESRVNDRTLFRIRQYLAGRRTKGRRRASA